jgi:hypothetical protein
MCLSTTEVRKLLFLGIHIIFKFEYVQLAGADRIL